MNCFYHSDENAVGFCKVCMEIAGPTRAELLVVGRFEGPRPGIPIGTEGRKIFTGHGHMSQYKYKFVVQCVEQVKPVPFP